MNDFFATLYESLFFIDTNNFSENMFLSGAYVSIGLIMVISSLISELLYYYFISNYKMFYKRTYWFLWIAFTSLINFIAAYSMSFSAMATNGDIYTLTEYFAFSMVNILWTMAFCFLFSIVFKFKSIRASRTPF